MNLFQRKTQQPAIAPAPLSASPLEIAERAVERANERVTTASREFREMQERFQIRVDRNGSIAFAVVPDVSFRAELENEMRAKLRCLDDALRAFYAALNVWGGLKNNGGKYSCQ